jgi:predicted RNase H-like HicB family nuclease
MAAGSNEGKSPAVQESIETRNRDGRRQTEPRHSAGHAEFHLEAIWIEDEEDWRMTRYMVVIERGAANWGAHVPDLPGCVAVGETRDEVLSLIREAIALHIEELRRSGLPVPKPSSEGEFVDVEAA